VPSGSGRKSRANPRSNRVPTRLSSIGRCCRGIASASSATVTCPVKKGASAEKKRYAPWPLTTKLASAWRSSTPDPVSANRTSCRSRGRLFHVRSFPRLGPEASGLSWSLGSACCGAAVPDHKTRGPRRCGGSEPRPWGMGDVRAPLVVAAPPGWNALSSAEGGIAHRWRWDSRVRRTATHTPKAGYRRDQGRNPFSRRPLALRGIGPCSFLTVRRQGALRAPLPGASSHAPAERCVWERVLSAVEVASRTQVPDTTGAHGYWLVTLTYY